MNDDLMDMIRIGCDECVCDDDIARAEYERGEREREECERQEYWEILEAEYGPLYTTTTEQWFLGGTYK